MMASIGAWTVVNFSSPNLTANPTGGSAGSPGPPDAETLYAILPALCESAAALSRI